MTSTRLDTTTLTLQASITAEVRRLNAALVSPVVNADTLTKAHTAAKEARKALTVLVMRLGQTLNDVKAADRSEAYERAKLEARNRAIIASRSIEDELAANLTDRCEVGLS